METNLMSKGTTVKIKTTPLHLILNLMRKEKVSPRQKIKIRLKNKLMLSKATQKKEQMTLRKPLSKQYHQN